MKPLEEFFKRCLHLTETRGKHYGQPHVNLNRIAKMWSIYLTFEVSAEDVAVMMACLKIARLAEDWHQDSIEDAATYLALANLVKDEHDPQNRG